MKTEEDFAVIDAMVKYGGSFVHALGLAAMHADSQNLHIIKTSWPTYWKTYQQMAEKR